LKEFADLTGEKIEIKPTDDTMFIASSQLKSLIMGSSTITFAVPCTIIKPMMILRLNCKQKLKDIVNVSRIACPMCTNKVIGTFK